MKVLIGCEYSGRVRDAFAELGHDATSCDLLPTEVPGDHIEDNIFHVLQSVKYSSGMDIFIAHPPCTFLANSGVRWLYNKDGSRNEDRWQKMEEAALFF